MEDKYVWVGLGVGIALGAGMGETACHTLGVATGLDFDGVETIAEVAGAVGGGSVGYKWGKGADDFVSYASDLEDELNNRDNSATLDRQGFADRLQSQDTGRSRQ